MPLYCYINNILNSDTLPGLMQNIGLGLMTIFIPLVIFLLDKERDAFPWDKIVILDKVIRAKSLFIALCLTFLPILFWDFIRIRIILFIIFGISIYYIIKIIIRSYNWLRTLEIDNQYDPQSFRNLLRNEYLDTNGGWLEKEKIWTQTWRKLIDSNIEERNLIRKFSSSIHELIKNKSFEASSRFLRTFHEHIDKRSLYDWIIFGELFENLLEWNFALYQENKNDIDTDSKLRFFETQTSIVRLIEKLVIAALKKGTSYMFFDKLKEHIKDKDKNYLNLIFSHICRVFFENIGNSDQNYEIWENYFPNDWKIRASKLEKGDSDISMIWLSNFFEWANKRFWRGDKVEGFDKNLDQVSSGLFPSVEQILWAKILIFLFRPWTDNNRMKSLIETGRNFGFTSGVIVTTFGSADDATVELDRQIKEREVETIKLAIILFAKELTKSKIQKHISELKELKYDIDSKEESRRMDYLSIFEKILEALE